MNPSFVILSTYTNERTYARYAFTEDFAGVEAEKLRKYKDIIKVVIEPYLGKTYFPEEIQMETEEK